jgi:hypothetical protein
VINRYGSIVHERYGHTCRGVQGHWRAVFDAYSRWPSTSGFVILCAACLMDVLLSGRICDTVVSPARCVHAYSIVYATN